MAQPKHIKEFIDLHFRHFNAASVRDAALGWIDQLKKGNKMFLAMAGAMSTAELGISLAEMIRQGKVHAISTTGANLEEDIFNLVAHDYYKRIPDYRMLTAQQELELREKGLNRVTDTCIPEHEAMRRMEDLFLEVWQRADKEKRSFFHYEYFYQLIRAGKLAKSYQIDPKHSWVIAACERNLPIYTPGCEDSTLLNFAVSHVMEKRLSSTAFLRSGIEQMIDLVKWYGENTKNQRIGFFQIGGGIAGDFPICAVPLIRQDLRQEDAPHWSYFCQISDSTTSYGSYSGAVPNEKITWDKISIDTPRFIIESDATIVAPLIFRYVLESD